MTFKGFFWFDGRKEGAFFCVCCSFGLLLFCVGSFWSFGLVKRAGFFCSCVKERRVLSCVLELEMEGRMVVI